MAGSALLNYRGGAAAAKNSSTNSCETLIDELAKAGNAGSQRGNCHRDVVSKLGARAKDAPQCYAAKVKFWNKKEGCSFWDTMYFMLPHEIIDHAIKKSGDLSQWVGFGHNANLAKRFETWCRDNGSGDVSPSTLIGCGIWGDGAAFHTRNNLFVLLVNVVSGVHKRRFWICAFSKDMLCACGCKGRCTFDSIWQIVAWSFR